MILRHVELADEPALRAAHQEFLDEAEEMRFLLASYRPGEPFEPWLRRVEPWRYGCPSEPDAVDASFLVAEDAGVVVGRVSIRHALNARLEKRGGHIGYAVRRQHRNKGYATAMLNQALACTDALGIERVVLTCNEENVASQRVIERCGGVLQDTYLALGRMTRRYVIHRPAR